MKSVIVIFLFFITDHCFAQNYFDEAIKISQVIKNNKDAKSTFDVVSKSFAKNNGVPKDVFTDKIKPTPPPAGAVAIKVVPKDTSLLIEDTLNKELLRQEIDAIFKLNNNPCPSIDDFPSDFKYLDDISKSTTSGFGNGGLNPANFGFSESAIIYGITDFVIKRAKEELIETYLNEWYQKLNNDKIIQPLIPQTLSVYNAFMNDNALNIAKYGDKWKNAFQEDIRNIPVQLQNEDYINIILTRVNISNDLKTQLLPVIAGGDELVYNLYLKKHLVNILAGISSKYLNGTDTLKAPVFKRAIVLASLLAKVCGKMETNNNYQLENIDDLSKMDVDTWQIFLKLLYLRNKKDIEVITGMEAAKFCNMINNKGAIERFGNLIRESITILNSYQTLLSGTNAQTTKQLSLDDSRKLFDLSYQILDNTVNYMELMNIGSEVINTYKNNIRPYFINLSEIGEGVSTLQYGKVLDGCIGVIRKTASFGSNNLDSSTIKNLQRYGSFMVNVLTAQDANEVETALDEIVPKGQYQLKNTKSFTASLSAYPGIFTGAETIKKYRTDNTGSIDYKLGKTSSTALSLSPYLPIGIDLSFGDKLKVRKGIERRASTNVFFQLLDLGAVLNYRINSDSTVSSNPDVSFKQMLSPGIALMRHFSNSPLSLGVGVNYTPDLRKINQGGIVYEQNALRYGIFLGVDVTGLIIHSSKSTAEHR